MKSTVIEFNVPEGKDNSRKTKLGKSQNSGKAASYYLMVTVQD